MLQVLTHPNLSHQFVLVSVHTGQLTNMSKSELKTIGKLEGVDVSESILNMRINNKFGESEDFSTKMEGVSESGLLPLLRSKGLDRLQAGQENS